ncbi:Protein-S-isoprenylcysteine O-methyltransferase Ste14 [Nocardioides alpinus]|uniref:Isoprenylcysteine carboxylmethyltransferase family protein n=1 Tax=Nocardioides alpinus TaxID=748909 RepID=A0A1I1AK59_9ACTN|nr:isoprenylcysteine carboxylmethyltransferase family protein [Nocardioides alpinus]PKH41741.1 isoprenylcysteine carboxylmethyltransferase family protein [Nocardioides alpinus]SFB38415.1 Protein-S-isoprenylcysteine O-methyltransferase Ste14 [Nocardioides alpinus]
MTWAAIGAYAVYLLVAFVARTVIQVRRTGDSGFRGLGGRVGSVEWSAGILFAVALVVGFAAPVAGLFGLPPIARFDHLGLNVVGLLIAAGGIALTLAAQLRMGSEWRIGVDVTEQTSLVTDGLFRFVRNPIFTAMSLTALGLTLMVPNAVAVAGLACLVAALQLQVRVVEEPYLRALHGPEYAHYEASTGRFLPGIGKSAGARGRVAA